MNGIKLGVAEKEIKKNMYSCIPMENAMGVNGAILKPCGSKVMRARVELLLRGGRNFHKLCFACFFLLVPLPPAVGSPVFIMLMEAIPHCKLNPLGCAHDITTPSRKGAGFAL